MGSSIPGDPRSRRELGPIAAATIAVVVVSKLSSTGIAIAVALLFGSTHEGRAGDAPVTLGEVTVQASSRTDVDADALRSMAADALESIDGAKLPAGTRSVLSLSLVRLESRASTPAEVSCQVSATLRDRKGGTLLAILDGSARGQDEPRRLPALERATMRAAVGSAVARVPEAIGRRAR
jgi:hypothetical protein